MTNHTYKPSTICPRCDALVTNNNFNRHYMSKSCLKNLTHKKPYIRCPHCDEDLSDKDNANHIRWCPKNTNISDKSRKPGKSWNSGLSKETDKRLMRISENIKNLHDNGFYDDVKKPSQLGRKHTELSKKKISESARNSKHVRKCKNSHEFIDKIGRKFIFDSSWEDALAIKLDELNIQWDRPAPIQYSLEGKIHNYFPDFYLPEYDLYLDPKNSWVENQQQQKIEAVSTLINLRIIRSLEDCVNFSI